nr:unnamed protein product [Digitaria exilis]
MEGAKAASMEAQSACACRFPVHGDEKEADLLYAAMGRRDDRASRCLCGGFREKGVGDRGRRHSRRVHAGDLQYAVMPPSPTVCQ